MASMKSVLLGSGGLLFVFVSVAAMAQTTTRSPFASKKPKAWETQAPAPTSAPQSSPYQVPSTPYQAPSYTPPAAPSYPAAQPSSYGTYTHTPAAAPTAHQYTPPLAGGAGAASGTFGSAGTYSAPSPTHEQPSYVQPTARTLQPDGQYYPGKTAAPVYGGDYGQPTPVAQQPYSGTNYGGSSQNTYQGYAPDQNVQNTGAVQAPVLRGASEPYQYPPSPNWLAKLSGGGLESSYSGHVKVGAAGVDNAGWNAQGIADIDVRGEVSAITQGGLEYGVGARARAQYDRYRRGFGGRVGDCPAADPACSGVLVGADTRSVKGHTGQFYTGGASDAQEAEVSLDGAYIFLRSAYGDVVFGRDDGSASLFSLGAPSLVAVRASNSPVDYTGLDSVKTVNDASGFAEKIAYTSPRLLGDQIGVGVQFGLSYAPNARACGVDYCVRENSGLAVDPFAPDIKNVVEVGVAFDRNFGNGLKVEFTGTYARGNDDTGLAIFDDLQTYGAGLEITYKDIVFGTSALNSNNGFAGQGDYNAYDFGVTWKPNKLGLSASYGYADDDIAHLSAHQGVVAVSYDLDNIRLGTGVQYVKRNVPIITAGGRDKRSEDALALFIEAGFTF